MVLSGSTKSPPQPTPPIFSLTSTSSQVLRDEVAERTTPHEVLTKEASLRGKVEMITMPSSRFVFVRYGGDVIVEAPPTGDRVVATIPLGPMGVSHDYHVKPSYLTSGFLLSSTNNTVMHPDPWKGALVIASDPENLQRQRKKVWGDGVKSTTNYGSVSKGGTQYLMHTCRSLWEYASTMPPETPTQVVHKFLDVMQDSLLNALILATEDLAAPEPSESHRARMIIDWIEAHHSESLTVADLAAAAGLSVRQLQVSVQGYFAMSPVELLRDVRLSKLHGLLRDAHADQCTVATLTYSVGFTHLSRTAQLYRAKYGESPAQTLKRNMHG